MANERTPADIDRVLDGVAKLTLEELNQLSDEEIHRALRNLDHLLGELRVAQFQRQHPGGAIS